MEYHNRALDGIESQFHRYMYNKIDWTAQLIGLIGSRGVGKTTLILQKIKEDFIGDKVLYVNVEGFYFANHTLVELAESIEKQGYTRLFIDEVHRYPEWSRELKLIYDFHPRLKVVFTGSSILDIKRGVSDLSRRALMYSMQGLSFREYLSMNHGITAPLYDLEQVIGGEPAHMHLPTPLIYFNEYLKRGYYPFMNAPGYTEKLNQVINQTLEVDIPAFARLNASKGYQLKRLMAIIAESVPFKPNMTKIANIIGVSRNDIGDYFDFMEEAGMIMQLRDTTHGIRALGKPDKVYLENSNLIYALSPGNANIGNVRETFFLNQLRVGYPVKSSRISDFEIGGRTFEIGGANKGQSQIVGAKEGYVVKDNIETAYSNVIPLWYFGLIY